MMESKISYTVEDDLIAGVITAAVMSEKRRSGLWQDMLRALDRGAAETEAGTAGAFFFRAMVDRLLEEFHALEKETKRLSGENRTAVIFIGDTAYWSGIWARR